MKDAVCPRQVQKLQYLLDRSFRLENELFIVHHETPTGADLFALFRHGFNTFVPQPKVLPVVGETEAGDCHFARHHRVDHSSRVTHHEQELRVRKDRRDVGCILEHEWIFIAENISRLAVLDENFIHKCSNGRVENCLRHSTGHETKKETERES